MDKRNKVEQLCQFKLSYLNKYSHTKYLISILACFLAVGAVIWLNVHVYEAGDSFERQLETNSVKANSINLISRDVS